MAEGTIKIMLSTYTAISLIQWQGQELEGSEAWRSVSLVPAEPQALFLRPRSAEHS